MNLQCECGLIPPGLRGSLYSTIDRARGRLDKSVSCLKAVLRVAIDLKIDRQRPTADVNRPIHGIETPQKRGNPGTSRKLALSRGHRIYPVPGTDNVKEPTTFYNIGCHVST
ncbi:hypothetical protein SH528x_000450 [Novipirellula sp. SH528]|uniref:hypothetical protein n=1 Tax=Novipirellula sp. SH528 TaxID=3454466 RepID=UPI003FA092A4